MAESCRQVYSILFPFIEKYNVCTAAFTGLSSTHKNWLNFTKFKVNANKAPGLYDGKAARVPVDLNEKSGVYGVSDYKPMLNESRVFLNKIFHDACHWLKSEYNIHYTEAC